MTPGVNALRFRCPNSAREIESDFSADAHTLSMIRLFSVRLLCPACGELHEFKMAEALAFPAGEGMPAQRQPADVKPASQGRRHSHG